MQKSIAILVNKSHIDEIIYDDLNSPGSCFFIIVKRYEDYLIIKTREINIILTTKEEEKDKYDVVLDGRSLTHLNSISLGIRLSACKAITENAHQYIDDAIRNAQKQQNTIIQTGGNSSIVLSGCSVNGGVTITTSNGQTVIKIG